MSSAPHCPTCGHKTKRVSAVTMRAMLDPDALASLDGVEGFRFCSGATCPTVYAKEGRDETVGAAQLRLPVFQKSDDPDRLICYCFRHTLREVMRDAQSDEPHIADDIRDKCHGGLDHCEQENPQGSCCLGNIARVADQ